MTPEITTSLVMSMKLKEAGWPQSESAFIYIHFDAQTKLWSRWSNGEPRGGTTDGSMEWAAPTTEELLGSLPDFLTIEKANAHSEGIRYRVSNDNGEQFYDISLANAAAQMWIYLKENNLQSAK